MPNFISGLNWKTPFQGWISRGIIYRGSHGYSRVPPRGGVRSLNENSSFRVPPRGGCSFIDSWVFIRVKMLVQRYNLPEGDECE
jgi:hypothetical protein